VISERKRSGVGRFVFISVLALVAALTGTTTGSAAAEVETFQATPQVPKQSEYVPPAPGEPAPLPEMPGMSPAAARDARRKLAEYDAKVAAAMIEADNAYRSQARIPGAKVEPIAPKLPKVERPDGPIADMLRLPDLQYAVGPAGGSGRSALTSNTQSDGVHLTDHPDDVYASDYQVWLAIPQSNETNKCDGSNYSSGCFWFYAMQYDTDCSYCSSAIHIGPQRGDNIAGNAGANWLMNIDGYNNGVHIGGQSTTILPVATWIRVRTWRLSSGTDPGYPETPWAIFGVWAMWGGNDHYLGHVKVNGTWIAHSGMFMELNEVNGPCSTDLERGYLLHPIYQRNGSWYGFLHGTASYDYTCDNTSWIVQGAPDFIRDERETTPRVIKRDDPIW